jgi:hypothetical protein
MSGAKSGVQSKDGIELLKQILAELDEFLVRRKRHWMRLNPLAVRFNQKPPLKHRSVESGIRPTNGLILTRP